MRPSAGLAGALTVGLALACSGGEVAETPPNLPNPTPPPSAPPQATKPAVPPAEKPDAWGDKYWVILQSDRDASKAPPSLATIAAHAELGLTPAGLPSSRFKNLMPCYEVIVADAKADKAEAVALSKRLTELGVDNYVKNAGPYVGRRAAVDAWCAASDPAVAPDGVWWAFSAGGSSWMLLGDDPAIAESARLGAPKATMRDRSTWVATLSAETIGRWKVGDPVSVVQPSGPPNSCKILRFADLTTGTPHFGVFQADEDPSAPTCGAPALAAELDCAVTEGALVVPPTAPAPTILAVGAPVTEPAVADAARKAFAPLPEWTESRTWGEGSATEAVTVTPVTSAAGPLWLVEGRITAEGGCGGVDEAFFVLLDPKNPGGAPIAGPTRASFGQLRAVVDLGKGPELWLSNFPAGEALIGAAGPRAPLDIAYCDCGC